MKVIRYVIANETNIGTEDSPNILRNFHSVSVPWSESYEKIAQKEAYNGEITIEDDGQPEPEPAPEYATYAQLAAAIREGVNSVE